MQIISVSYAIKDLGTLENKESSAYGINDNNVVVGTLQIDKTGHDFIWDEAKGLICLTVSSSYQQPKINNKNQMAGIYWNRTHYWITDNKITKRFYLSHLDGSFRNIEVPYKWNVDIFNESKWSSEIDKNELAVVSITDNGQILVSNSADQNKATATALWQNGKFTNIETKDLKKIYCMNNRGILLGRKLIKKPKGEVPMLVLFDPQTKQTTIIMKDVNLSDRQLNNRDQFIAIQQLEGYELYKTIVWDSKQGLNIIDNFFPTGSNNHNQIVGNLIVDGKLKPFLWHNGNLIDLEKATDFTSCEHPWEGLHEVTGINNAGYIVGSGIINGKKQACLLIPVSKP